jgi:DNA-binding GntR family transcriptional regulator
LTDAELDGLDAELPVLAAAVERGDVIAFRRLNDQWHRSIVQRGTGPGVLEQLLEQLHRNAGRYRAAGDQLDDAYMLASQAEHEQLLGLLRQRRAADAELLCRQHARTFVEHLARHLDPARDHLPT